MTNRYPTHLLKLIDVLRHLPGVGAKSAERYAFEMMDWEPSQLSEMAAIIASVPTHLAICQECGCLGEPGHCVFCKKNTISKTLCIVAAPRDVFAIEATHEYHGYYHVLGALLSPIDGIGPDQIDIEKLKKRIQTLGIEEVVVALDSTLQGDATSLYLKQELIPLNLKISRLAFGLPMGSSLDYVDGGTLARALTARGNF